MCMSEGNVVRVKDQLQKYLPLINTRFVFLYHRKHLLSASYVLCDCQQFALVAYRDVCCGGQSNGHSGTITDDQFLFTLRDW